MDFDYFEEYGDISPDTPDYGLELLKWAKSMAQQALDSENDSDYVVNQKQMEIFVKVQLYFYGLIDRNYGEWVHANVRSPKERNGYITVRVGFISFNGDTQKTKEFCQMLNEACSISIIPKAEGEYVDISLVIPDIFIKK